MLDKYIGYAFNMINEPPRKPKLPSMRKRDTILSKEVNALVDKIQRDSHRDVYERFGPGPHRVQFSGTPGFSKYHTFVVELALASLCSSIP